MGQQKISSRREPSGEPMATPSVCLNYCPLNKKICPLVAQCSEKINSVGSAEVEVDLLPLKALLVCICIVSLSGTNINSCDEMSFHISDIADM